jgi:3,8-divinyl chlorophyllide a/chlorophyllide a reductase subunit Y
MSPPRRTRSRPQTGSPSIPRTAGPLPRRCAATRAMRDARRRAGRRQERDAGAVRRRLSQGPARPAAEHVPGLRLAARGPAHAPHATILSGSACCVYGLTFTSHFYGARRSVGYVPFNSETLVTGKLFEDIREAVHAQADPALYDAIVIINLCVPTASGVPLQLLPKEINGVRIIGIDVPGLRRADARRGQGRAGRRDAALRPHRGRGRPGAAPRGGAPTSPRHAAGRDVPGRPGGHRHDARAPGPGRRPGGAHARMARALCRARLRAVAAIHPFYTASVREFEAAGRPVVGSAPVGHDGTEAWLQAIGDALQRAAGARSTRPRTAGCPPSGRAGAKPIKGRITLSRLRRLRAAGRPPAGRKRRRPALRRHRLPAHALVDADREWLEARGVHVQYRASAGAGHRRDARVQPDLAIGTTPVVQAAKQAASRRCTSPT